MSDRLDQSSWRNVRYGGILGEDIAHGCYQWFHNWSGVDLFKPLGDGVLAWIEVDAKLVGRLVFVDAVDIDSEIFVGDRDVHSEVFRANFFDWESCFFEIRSEVLGEGFAEKARVDCVGLAFSLREGVGLEEDRRIHVGHYAISLALLCFLDCNIRPRADTLLQEN